MDTLIGLSVYLAPATLIGWVIYFFLLRRSRKGMFIFWASFLIYTIIAAWFLVEMANDDGWFAGLGPLLIGCGALTSYSLMMFILLFFVYRSIKKNPPGSVNK